MGGADVVGIGAVDGDDGVGGGVVGWAGGDFETVFGC